VDRSSAESRSGFKQGSCPQPSAQTGFPLWSARTSAALQSKTSSARTGQLRMMGTTAWVFNTGGEWGAIYGVS